MDENWTDESSVVLNGGCHGQISIHCLCFFLKLALSTVHNIIFTIFALHVSAEIEVVFFALILVAEKLGRGFNVTSEKEY